MTHLSDTQLLERFEDLYAATLGSLVAEPPTHGPLMAAATELRSRGIQVPHGLAA